MIGEGASIKGEIKEENEINVQGVIEGDISCNELIVGKTVSIKGKIKTIKWIQSFADERCGGLGIVYQACSFDYYGEHKSIFWTLKGEVYHNSLMTRNPNLRKMAAYLQANKENATSQTLRQFRYIKFIDKREKRNCLLKEQPYPKHYEENKIK